MNPLYSNRYARQPTSLPVSSPGQEQSLVHPKYGECNAERSETRNASASPLSPLTSEQLRIKGLYARLSGHPLSTICCAKPDLRPSQARAMAVPFGTSYCFRSRDGLQVSTTTMNYPRPLTRLMNVILTVRQLPSYHTSSHTSCNDELQTIDTLLALASRKSGFAAQHRHVDIGF